jgi:hypothetical protein
MTVVDDTTNGANHSFADIDAEEVQLEAVAPEFSEEAHSFLLPVTRTICVMFPNGVVGKNTTASDGLMMTNVRFSRWHGT